MQDNSLEKIREKINETDNSIAKLFEERMKLSAEVAEEKQKSGGRIYNPKRERDIISRLTENCDEKTAVYLKILYNTVFNLSRSYQAKIIYKNSCCLPGNRGGIFTAFGGKAFCKSEHNVFRQLQRGFQCC